MSSFRIFDIAGSGMAAQNVRLNTVASNLANVNSVAQTPQATFRARHPVFQALYTGSGSAIAPAVRVLGIVESQAAPLARYEPGNPLADAQGYVYAPNVNIVEQLIDMISAARSYQNNVEMLNTSKEL
ncbi:MAG: flagellar basal body rod protein FlgC, partial [Steroidobacteraceae bacterium]|nr:flagellar basal body rod protein FlgC [Steroidobacteraceae bacterium]